MQGFRKIDPDGWEFSNEGFLGGQKHLLKTIKRRRNILQNSQQQGGGACVELGQFGLDGKLDRLKRDLSEFLPEIERLRQQQQHARDQNIAMEDRLQSTERKQQQIMTFLSKALRNPTFIQQFAQKKQMQGVEIGRKRGLTASPSIENLQEAIPVVVDTDQVIDYTNQDQEELETIESEIETFFTSALDNESSSEIKDPITSSVPTSGGANLGVNDTRWEESISEDLIAGESEDEGYEAEIDVEVEDLAVNPADWADVLQDLMDQMGYLRSEP